MRIGIDLDGVLCKDLHKDYTKTEIREEYVPFINKLHELGEEIVIYTSRGWMKGEDWLSALDFTVKQLDDAGVKYDEIIHKPFFDIYIEDKAINSIDTLKKLYAKFGRYKKELKGWI